MSNHALIDGDVIIYAVGFAAETTCYLVDDKTFDGKEDAEHYCERYGLTPDDIEQAVRPEPIDHCLATVKRMLERIKKGAQAATSQIYLTGKDNFREKVATVQVYKGNRLDARKPLHYENIRDYLTSVHGAIVVDGEEADDQLSIQAMKREHNVICTVDKDLDNTPGLHYNWNHDELYDVGHVEADRNFHLQLLTGDSVDHIPGLYKLTGTRASAKKKEVVRQCRDALEMYDAVFDIYVDALVLKAEKEGDEEWTYVKSCRTATKLLTEIGQLLWMRRTENELWQPPNSKLVLM